MRNAFYFVTPSEAQRNRGVSTVRGVSHSETASPSILDKSAFYAGSPQPPPAKDCTRTFRPSLAAYCVYGS